MSKFSLFAGSMLVLVAFVAFNPVEAAKKHDRDIAERLEELQKEVAKILENAKEKAEEAAKNIAARAKEQVAAAIKAARDTLAGELFMIFTGDGNIIIISAVTPPLVERELSLRPSNQHLHWWKQDYL
ncbi:uncharacterized protein [Battus philenor]|uniref:uncharacterized protein n=1 Tax=Battus philenor TaxID=42288 RepID=UPI0035D0589F